MRYIQIIILSFFFYSNSFPQITSNYFHTSVQDFRVSDGMTGLSMHNYPSVDSDSSGNFTVVWIDSRTGTPYLYAQIFEQDGTPISNNIIVNEKNPCSYDGVKPYIAVNNEGNFMITWRDYDNIYICHFDSHGNKLKDIIFNDTPDHNFSDPKAIVDGHNNFVVCFTAFKRVYIQKFDTNGNKVGGLIKLQDDNDPWDYYGPSNISSDNEGNFYFVWLNYGYPQSNEIFLQRFTNNGEKIGDLIFIENTWSYYNINPKVTVSHDKSFIVSWCDSYNQVIRTVGLSNEGLIQENAFIINELPFDDCDFDVKYNNNNYIFVWDQYAQKLDNNFKKIESNYETIEDKPNSIALSVNNLGSTIIYSYNSQQIYGQIFNNNGSEQGAKFIVNDNIATSPEYSPTIAVSNSGNFAVSWIDTRNNFDELFYQSFNSEGEKLSENFSTKTKINKRMPLNIISDNENFLMLFESQDLLKFSGYNITLQNTIIDSFVLNHRSSNNGSIAQNGNDHFIYCSISSINQVHKLNIYKYSYKGIQVGEIIEIIRYADGVRLPSISSNDNGEFIITWVEYMWNDYEAIYAQRFDKDTNKVGIPFRVLKVNIGNYELRKTIASQQVTLDNDGNFYFAWLLHYYNLSGTPNIFLTKYSFDNQLQNTVNVCPSGIPVPKQKLAMSTMDLISGKFILLWEDIRNHSSDIYAQLFSPDSLRIGNNFRLSNTSDGNQTNPSVVFENGKIYSTWIDSRSEERGIDIWANVLESDYVNSINKKDVIPKEFLLNQNYPNPFNPNTIITYSIPTSETVILTVYDISGSKISTLVNEKQSAGSYKINFNALGLSSGVYYYQIKAGNFIKAKKMILLK